MSGTPKINEYLFTVTGVKKMKWFLSLTRCHFQPQVTEGHEWLEVFIRESLWTVTFDCVGCCTKLASATGQLNQFMELFCVDEMFDEAVAVGFSCLSAAGWPHHRKWAEGGALSSPAYWCSCPLAQSTESTRRSIEWPRHLPCP